MNLGRVAISSLKTYVVCLIICTGCKRNMSQERKLQKQGPFWHCNL
jgi:hypothetical protein